jgi:adenine phosphoribosyltransferase
MDDLLATGGTVEATINIVKEAGGEIVGLGFMIELVDLKGRDKFNQYPIKVLMQY